MKTLLVEEGGTGISVSAQDYSNVIQSVSNRNYMRDSCDSGLIDFLGGFFVMMICMIIFFCVIALVVKVLGPNKADCEC